MKPTRLPPAPAPSDTHHRSPAARRSLGAVMTEMVLAMPFLLLVLSLLFFLGRGMVRLQRAWVMDRYEAWREVARSWGPASNDPLGSPQLNDTFFAGRATAISQSTDGWFPDNARDELESAAGAFSGDTQSLVREAHDAFADGRSVRLTTQHSESMTLWKQFDHTYAHRHSRIEHEWKFMNRWIGAGASQERPRGEDDDGIVHGAGSDGPWMLPETRDVFMLDIDEPLRNLQEGGNYLAGSVRAIYTARPAYRGPRVP